MQSKRARLDRFLSAHLGINRRDVKLMLARQRIVVDGQVAREVHELVDEFTRVTLDGNLLQEKHPVYVMLHKPLGIVSATKDTQHTTVIDLLKRTDRTDLHIVGRLDVNSSGLILLTNNGRWSRALTHPRTGVVKRYRVTLASPIDENYVEAFAEGMYFPYEGITTLPARLEIIDAFTAEVYLMEGRYHQIRRMFGRFQNQVLTLHREAIGHIELGSALAPGESRELTPEESALGCY